MIRPHKLLVLLLVAGSVGCGKSSKPTGLFPGGSDGWVQAPSPGGRAVASLAVIGTNLFAGTDGGVFRSTDNAASWTAVNNGLTTATPVTALVVNGTSMFAVTTNPGYFSGVFRSTDNGANWVPVNNGLTPLVISGLAVCGTSVFVTGSNNISPDAGGVFRSIDDGANWTAVNNGLTTKDVYSLAVGGTSLFATTYDSSRDTFEVFRSIDNGANWTAVTNGLTAEIVRIDALAESGTSLFAGTEVIEGHSAFGRVYRLTDNGASWLAADHGMEFTYAGVFAVSGTSLFAGTQLGGVYRTIDNGANWAQFNGGMPYTTIIISDMAVIGTNLFAGSTYFDWSGSTWRPALWRHSL